MTAVDAAGHRIDEAVRTKALAVLRDGRLRLLGVRTDAAGRLLFCDAVVYGHRGEHSVGWGARPGGAVGWSCTCPENRDGRVCAHVFAAELVCHGVWPPGRDGQPKGRPVRKKGGR